MEVAGMCQEELEWVMPPPPNSRLGACADRLALCTGPLCSFCSGLFNFLPFTVSNWFYSFAGEHLGLESEEYAKAS